MRQLFIFAILGGLLLVVHRHPDATDTVLSAASKDVSDTLHLKDGLSMARQATTPGLQVARQGVTSAWSNIDKAFDLATKSNVLEDIQSGFSSAVSLCSEWTTNALDYVTGDFGRKATATSHVS